MTTSESLFATAVGRPEMPYGWGRVPYGYDDRLPWRNLPFDDAEYEQRIARLNALMREEGMDCLVLWGDRADGSNVRYLTNFEDFYGGQTIVVISIDGKVGMTTNAVMHGEPMHSGIQDAWPRDIRCAAAPRTVTGSASPVNVFNHIADFIREAGTVTHVGLVGPTPSMIDDLLSEVAPGASTARADALLARMRTIKSPAEVEVMRKACHIADVGLIAGMEAVNPGVTEFDIAAEANYAMFKAGAEHPSFPIAVVTGERSGFKHMAPTNEPIKAGDMVYIDLGGRYMGYYSDCSRQTVAGEPSPEQLRLMETQIEIVEAVMAAAKPGVAIGELAKIGVSMAEEAGYADYLYFRGHGIGCHTHDRPSIAPGNPVELEAGMVFCFEPMLVKFRFGTACWEDIWHVTPSGVERLNEAPYRFW